MVPQRVAATLFSFLALTVATGIVTSCSIPPPFHEDPAERTEELYARRLAEIDRLADLGRVRDAINLARRALIDHYYSEELKDRLGELISIRQVMYERNMQEAEERLEAGAPRTAIAILDEIDRFGDEAMIAAADAKKETILAAHPAIFSSEARPRPATSEGRERG